MADAVATKVMVDGPSRYAALFTNISDGTGESAVTKIDVSALAADGNGRPCTSIDIIKIHYATFGMSVRILWDADTDDVAWLVPADMDGEHCFQDFAGLQNPKSTGWTGDVKFTTVGHTAADTYSIIIEGRKRFD